MTRDERILKDLGQHLRDKIVQNVIDFDDLCQSAGLDQKLIASETMSLLIHLTATYAASRFHLTAAEFTHAARLCFEHANKTEARK